MAQHKPEEFKRNKAKHLYNCTKTTLNSKITKLENTINMFILSKLSTVTANSKLIKATK